MAYRILAVDDSATIRAMVTILIRKLIPGAEVVDAPDGRAGLELLKKRAFDLILTDLQMPEMDGFQLIEEARKIAHCETTPIIVLTSRTEESEIDRALALGASGFLNKPIVAAELEETVRRTILS